MTAAGRSRADSDDQGEARQRPGRFWLWIAIIAVVALGVRLWATTGIPPGVFSPFGGDGYLYHLNARALATGEWYVNTVDSARPYDALHPPLWTAVLGGTIRLGLVGDLQIQTVTALIGVATVVLVGMLGRRVAGVRAGIIAAGLAAVNPGLWIYERNINAETLVFPLVAAVLLAAYRFRARPSVAMAGVLGLLVGLLALTRAEQIALLVLLVLPLIAWTTSSSRRHRLACVATSTAVVVLVAAPWTIFNLGRFERPVILSAGSGTAMVVGACDQTFYGDKLGGYDLTCGYTSPGQYVSDHTVRNSLQQEEALAYTRANLGRFPVVALARAGRSLGFYGMAQQAQANDAALRASPGLTWVQIAVTWFLEACAVVGAVLLRRRKRLLFPLLVSPALVLLASMATFGDSRYRASAEVSIVVLAATAMAALAALVGERVRRARRGEREIDLRIPAAGREESDADVVVDLRERAHDPAAGTRA